MPERRTSSTSSSSRSPITGRASGMLRVAHRAAPEGRRSRWKAYSSESTSASQLASITFAETPIEPQSSLAVGGVEQDARLRPRAVVLVEDPHLEVGQLDLGDLGMLLGDRIAQRPVERVDGAVALGGADVALAADPELDRRLGLDPAVGALLGDDAEALEPEERLVAARLAPQQQLEGAVGRLELVAAVLAAP